MNKSPNKQQIERNACAWSPKNSGRQDSWIELESGLKDSNPSTNQGLSSQLTNHSTTSSKNSKYSKCSKFPKQCRWTKPPSASLLTTQPISQKGLEASSSTNTTSAPSNHTHKEQSSLSTSPKSPESRNDSSSSLSHIRGSPVTNSSSSSCTNHSHPSTTACTTSYPSTTSSINLRRHGFKSP